ncbi:MAG TPA: amidase family protein, partial [Elusimicrobiales bacterium]|nr:amidase family protein [Elusimicrobiales bacterium]
MRMQTAFETAASVKSGKSSARKAVEQALEQIKKRADLGAFLEVFEQEALQRADAIDRKSAKGEKLGKLAGVPVALKDNLLYNGHNLTCGSKILQGYKAVYNATVVEKLLAEDAVLMGRTNMDEFAMGSSCENSAYQPTRNPADPERVPGGSSGGSAAAVAAEMSAIALGSDTGGSIRQPASLCGVVGLKPTYGLVSRYGLVAFASSLDQIGPFTSDVRDSALALSVLAGHDGRDSTSSDKAVPDYLAGIEDGVKGLKIGIPKEYFGSGLDPEVEKLVRASAAALEKSGAQLLDISLPYMKYAVAAYYIVASSEASSNLARFDGVRYGYS